MGQIGSFCPSVSIKKFATKELSTRFVGIHCRLGLSNDVLVSVARSLVQHVITAIREAVPVTV